VCQENFFDFHCSKQTLKDSSQPTGGKPEEYFFDFFKSSVFSCMAQVYVDSASTIGLLRSLVHQYSQDQ
jgi:hypothetical protein